MTRQKQPPTHPETSSPGSAPVRSRSRRRVLSVVVAAAVLVGGANLAAYAANGRPLLAGRATTATKTTTLTNSARGPALKLRTSNARPPLAVTSTAKVRKLNVDQVDGRSAGELATRSWTFELPRAGTATTEKIFSFPHLPGGTYLASYDVLVGASSASYLLCHLTSQGRTVGLSYGAQAFAPYWTTSGSAIVTGNAVPTMRCSASAPFRFSPSTSDSPTTVTFLQVDDTSRTPSTFARAGRAAPEEPSSSAAQ